MLKLKKITKSFGEQKVVNNLSFELNNGDIAGLLGPNGAGKTTTMRMITSYHYPNSGEILIDNQNTIDFTIETQSKIGYLPENNPLYPDMLVYDYLMMAAKLHGLNNQNAKLNLFKVSKEIEIKEKLATNIAELSKGYKQRVGMAAAMIHDPKILILDEPTEGLDPVQRKEIRELIKRISKNKIILISTHVMQEVKAMCNKVILINKGKLVFEGKIEDFASESVLKLKIEGTNLEKSLTKILDKKSQETIKILDNKSKVKVVEIRSKRDLTREISRIANKNNWTIREISREDNLESVFDTLKN